MVHEMVHLLKEYFLKNLWRQEKSKEIDKYEAWHSGITERR